MLNEAQISKVLEGHVFVTEYDDWKNPGNTIRHENSGWYAWEEHSDNEGGPENVNELGTVKVVEAYTGCEGGQEDTNMVFEVVFPDDTTRWFEKEGRYYSYDGTTWTYGSFREVKPQQKTITVYVSTKEA